MNIIINDETGEFVCREDIQAVLSLDDNRTYIYLRHLELPIYSPLTPKEVYRRMYTAGKDKLEDYL